MECIECKHEKMLHSEEIPLCEDCYETMFVMKHDVAVATPTDELHGPIAPADLKYVLNFHEGNIVSKGFTSVKFPKNYKVDFSKVEDTYDYITLLQAVLSEIIFADNHKDFDRIKHLLKEA